MSTLTFGKYKGELITRVPPSYLKFMVVNDTPQAAEAKAELERRGHTEVEIELSPHSIDRASQRCLSAWQQERTSDEGIYSWLHRRALEAHGEAKGQRNITVRGIKFVFADTPYPALQTVIGGGPISTVGGLAKAVPKEWFSYCGEEEVDDFDPEERP